MLYMISYDLNRPGQKYAPLDKRIVELGGVEILRSQWLMSRTESAQAIFKDLARIVDRNDGLIVTEITQNMEWSMGGLLITDTEMVRWRALARA